jgi:hypothetical protein
MPGNRRIAANSRIPGSLPPAAAARCSKGRIPIRFHRFKIEERLVDIEDDQGKSGHVMRLLFVAPGLEFVSLSVLVLEPAAVRGLFGAITADSHAAPSSCPPSGSGLGNVIVLAPRLPRRLRGWPTFQPAVRLRHRMYRAAHALMPPFRRMNRSSGSKSDLYTAAYRMTRLHLLRVRLSALAGSAVQRMTAANGSLQKQGSNCFQQRARRARSIVPALRGPQATRP